MILIGAIDKMDEAERSYALEIYDRTRELVEDLRGELEVVLMNLI
jgi:hypothetical protein